MDILEQFIRNVSYKFPKGYPDMKNDQDINFLSQMISEIVEGEFHLLDEDKRQDAEEIMNILKSELGLEDKDFKISGYNFYVLVPGSERLSYVDKIEAIKTKTGTDIKYDPTPSSFSSIGQFYYGDVKFGVKPSEKQGTGSAGLDNEDIFINNVNTALEGGPKNVIITDGKKSVKYSNISKAVGTGLETSDYSKSDVDFYDGEKKIGGLSLKKDNAIYWESADVRFKNEVANLADAITTGKLGDAVSYVPYVDARGNEDKAIIKMYNKKEDKPISGVIVDDLPEQDVQQVIFGNDNVPVAIRTWRPGDFKVEGDTLTITCSKLYVTMEDVIADNAQPILNIRHDKSRRKTRGLRALLQTKKSLFRKDSDDLKGNVVRLKYDSFN